MESVCPLPPALLVIRHQMRSGYIRRQQKKGHVIRIYGVMLKVVGRDAGDRHFLRKTPLQSGDGGD